MAMLLSIQSKPSECSQLLAEILVDRDMPPPTCLQVTTKSAAPSSVVEEPGPPTLGTPKPPMGRRVSALSQGL
jgi:hypothetical protein